MGAVDAVDFGFDVRWDDVAFDFSWGLGGHVFESFAMWSVLGLL